MTICLVSFMPHSSPSVLRTVGVFCGFLYKNASEKHQYSPEDFEKKTFPRNRTDLPDILDAMGLKKMTRT